MPPGTSAYVHFLDGGAGGWNPELRILLGMVSAAIGTLAKPVSEMEISATMKIMWYDFFCGFDDDDKVETRTDVCTKQRNRLLFI
jgi:hypothetical protein